MGNSIQTPTATLRAVTIVVPQSKGGTGTNHENNVPIALNVVPTRKLGVPNGLAKADSLGYVDPQQLPLSAVRFVTIDGPDEIFQGQTVNFTITNFDINTTYTVEVSAGTVSYAGNSITYNAPATPQSVTMTVNGRECVFEVKQTAPEMPTITSPVHAAVLEGTSYTFTSSVYSGTLSPHQSSDWQIATDPAFANIAFSSLEDTNNKVNWPVTGLNFNTAYFARVRYKSANGVYGSWSNTCVFTTAPVFVFNETLAVDVLNYNMKAAAIAAGWNQVDRLHMTTTIGAGVKVGSTSAATPSFDTGISLPVGSLLNLVNNGSILGKGGNGGTQGVNGSAGGTALKAQLILSVTNNGTIGGGGGGGGFGQSVTDNQAYLSGSGGSGGQGHTPGLGGAKLTSTLYGPTPRDAENGLPGTSTAPGAGQSGAYINPYGGYAVQAGDGGAGGTLGSPGVPGGNHSYVGTAPTQWYPATLGGAGGKAVEGNVNIVWLTNGIRLGSIT